MRKLLKLWLYMIILSVLLCGCRKTLAEVPNSPDLVIRISLFYEHRGQRLERVYTDNSKMDVILYYLYDLTPLGRPEEDPESLVGDRCRITLHLSHGQTHIYRQFGNQYLSVDNRPWQKIDKKQASVLYHLVNHMESDK